MYNRHIEIKQYLLEKQELTYLTTVDEEFRRTLLLAVASSFENQFQRMIEGFVEIGTSSKPALKFLIKQRFLYRQYHSWFEWDKPTANKFWSFFGADFKAERVAEINESPEIGDAMRAFLELGNLRNQVVHEDFASFSVELTVEEIYAKYQSARRFVNYCETIFV